ncbi:hypothetical protein TrispH2_001560 [Trichoplax sp. H2]|nr:hypothetical protein TrispH2_001560 [Trichoplax sp. H2]|eukprot:RDD47042.1 hypothetical protein TrispH2_001560 [Trichoplax sp. H2]
MDLDPAQQAEGILILCVSCCFISGYAFIMDIHTAKVRKCKSSLFMTCTDLFLNHKFFTMCCIILVSLLATGVQQRIMAQTMYPFSLRLL